MKFHLRGGIFAAIATLAGCATTESSEIAPKNVSSQTRLLNLAGEVEQKGDATTALALYERAAAMSTRDPSIQVRLGEARIRADDLSGAEAAYRAALEIDPTNVQAGLALGAAQLRNGDAEAAAKTLAPIASEANSARAYNSLGTALVLQGRIDEAEAAFRQALRIQPGDLDMQTNLALAQASANKLPEASATMESVVRSPSVKNRHLVNALIVLELAGKTDLAQSLRISDMAPEGRQKIVKQAAQLSKVTDPSKRAKAIGLLAAG